MSKLLHFLCRKWKTVKTPSFGLVGLTVAQTFCKTISLYGFFPYHNSSSGAHYEPSLHNLTHSDVHDFNEEQRLLRSLHHEHLLRLLVNPCKKLVLLCTALDIFVMMVFTICAVSVKAFTFLMGDLF